MLVLEHELAGAPEPPGRLRLRVRRAVAHEPARNRHRHELGRVVLTWRILLLLLRLLGQGEEGVEPAGLVVVLLLEEVIVGEFGTDDGGGFREQPALRRVADLGRQFAQEPASQALVLHGGIVLLRQQADLVEQFLVGIFARKFPQPFAHPLVPAGRGAALDVVELLLQAQLLEVLLGAVDLLLLLFATHSPQPHLRKRFSARFPLLLLPFQLRKVFS